MCDRQASALCKNPHLSSLINLFLSFCFLQEQSSIYENVQLLGIDSSPLSAALAPSVLEVYIQSYCPSPQTAPPHCLFMSSGSLNCSYTVVCASFIPACILPRELYLSFFLAHSVHFWRQMLAILTVIDNCIC